MLNESNSNRSVNDGCKKSASAFVVKNVPVFKRSKMPSAKSATDESVKKRTSANENATRSAQRNESVNDVRKNANVPRRRSVSVNVNVERRRRVNRAGLERKMRRNATHQTKTTHTTNLTVTTNVPALHHRLEAPWTSHR
jgi:hypothetical protein